MEAEQIAHTTCVPTVETVVESRRNTQKKKKTHCNWQALRLDYTTYLSDIDFAILIIIVGLHKARLQLL